MKRILIRGAEIIDPSGRISGIQDLLIEAGKIKKIGRMIPDVETETTETIEANGLAAFPGLVDMHVHLRDPGFTHKEDILTGCEAAAAGGVTSVACMPNTKPVTGTPEILEYILEKARQAKAHVYPVASITQDMAGETLSDFALLKKHGAVAFSDDGRPVKNARLMQTCMEEAFRLGVPVISHCEDLDIIGKGIMHKGSVSKRLGVEGMDRSSEDSITAREIALAAASGTAIHIAHVSTAGSVALIRDAKARGVRVTAETCPHYFMLTQDALLKRDADYRMNPPLREQADLEAVLAGVLDGTLDCIVTDHAPHTAEEKADFETAPNGVVGLETSLAASLTALYHTGLLTLEEIARRMSTNPARILHIPGGTLEVGAAADIALVDVNREWTVEPQALHSRSKNTVFKGCSLRGKVLYTLCGGQIVYRGSDHHEMKGE
ncbi:MAG TPA: dihydroorotase [Firmicutes bacterium]|nr:dihydroorotase [Bacillota bacterium]